MSQGENSGKPEFEANTLQTCEVYFIILKPLFSMPFNIKIDYFHFKIIDVFHASSQMAHEFIHWF